MKYNDVYIGARNLNNKEIKKILPSYDLLLSQIESIRETAKKIKNDGQKNFRRNYYNTISVWGDRGAGKSSVLYTIHEELEKEKYNIIFPIVEPDNISDSSSLIGIILNEFIEFFEEHVDRKIESYRYRKDNPKLNSYFKEDRYFKDSNPLRQKLNEILEAYCYREELYRDLLIQNFNNIQNYKKECKTLLSPDKKFEKNLKSFIEELINIYAIINNIDEKEILIFITIDDVDLKQEKSKEIIELILKYICHPNIVCLMVGDYETLVNSVTLDLIGKDLLKSNNLNEKILHNKKSIFDMKKDLAEKYLNKIIPAAYRHNLKYWTIENIHDFSFEIDQDGKSETNTKSVKLSEALKKKINKEKNIFGFVDNGKLVSNKIPYIIFPDLPRGLINILYSLECMNIEDNFYEVKQLIETMVMSSNTLNKFKEEFLEDFFVWRESFETSEILYGNFNCEEFSEYDNYEEKRTWDKEIYFFILCEFIKSLSNEVRFDENEYIKTKNYIIDLLIDNEYLNGREKNSLEFLREFLYNLEIEDVFAFLEVLKSKHNKLKIYDKEIEENIFFQCICEFMGYDNEKNILSNKSCDILEKIIVKCKNNYHFFYFMNYVSINSYIENYFKLRFFNKIDLENNKEEILVIAKPIYNYLEKITLEDMHRELKEFYNLYIDLLDNIESELIKSDETINLLEIILNPKISSINKRCNTEKYIKNNSIFKNIKFNLDGLNNEFNLEIERVKDIEKDIKGILKKEPIFKELIKGKITFNTYIKIIDILDAYAYEDGNAIEFISIKNKILSKVRFTDESIFKMIKNDINKNLNIDEYSDSNDKIILAKYIKNILRLEIEIEIEKMNIEKRYFKDKNLDEIKIWYKNILKNSYLKLRNNLHVSL
ncbi:MAG: hypothetical protein ACRC57_13835 [Sarcina sp.]